MPDSTEPYFGPANIFAVTGSAAADEKTATPTLVDHLAKAAPSRFDRGERFGDFLILRELGRGAFATVYLAHDVTLDRRIALKVSESSGHGEGQTLAELEHEHIVQVYAQFTDTVTGKYCLCLQYVPGTTLARVIERLHGNDGRPQNGQEILEAIGVESREEVPFDPSGLRNRQMLGGCSFTASVCWIGRQLADALHFAHRRGVLHCDIKPANVLINPYGRPLLADFNVSIDADPSRPGKSIGGTIVYMSPEQLSLFLRESDRAVDERSDIYSLGLLLFELLTGHLPIEIPEGGGKRELLRVLQSFGETNSWQKEGVPPVLERVLRRCLNPLPERRYAHAGELAQALANAFDLLNSQRSLSVGGKLTALALGRPVTMLIALTLLPQLAGSAVNIAYNAIEVRLNADQQTAFGQVVLAYNLIAYPIAVAIMLRLVVPIIRRWRKIDVSGAMTGAEVDSLRHASLRLSAWGIGLALAGWLPGGLVFPLTIDALAGPVGWPVYAHFALSFTLSGLIALIYSHFGIQFVVLRIFYPQLGNADTYSREKARAELTRASRWFGPFQSLAAAVPLTGAVLLVAVTRGEMTLSFRLLMTSLMLLGMVGVGIAIAVTRRLNAIVQVLEGKESR